jgi:WhiB family redox-sensing transcriptional regulator
MHPDAVAGLMLGHDVPDVAQVLGRPAWEAKAACRGLDVDLFVVPLGGNSEAGRAVCQRCPVVADCLDYALSEPELQGTWGGTGERQRRALRRVRQPPAVPPCVNCGAPSVDGERCRRCAHHLGAYGSERPRAMRRASA